MASHNKRWTWDSQLNLGWEAGNDTQNFVVYISVSRDNGKITWKEMSKLFSCDYNRQDMVKCLRDVSSEEMDKRWINVQRWMDSVR